MYLSIQEQIVSFFKKHKYRYFTNRNTAQEIEPNKLLNTRYAYISICYNFKRRCKNKSRELILDYGLDSELSVKVVEVLTKNDYGFFNVLVKLSGNSEVNYKHDTLILEKLAKPREITDFMTI